MSGLYRQSLLESFEVAIDGLGYAFRTQRNFKIHLTITVLVVVAGVVFGVSLAEWLILWLTIGGVLITELLNTAIESTVDLVVGGDEHPQAKIAKDVAAGACLLSAIMAVFIGVLIFLPPLLNRLRWG